MENNTLIREEDLHKVRVDVYIRNRTHSDKTKYV